MEYITSIENPNYIEGVDPIYLQYDIIAQHSDYGNNTPAGSLEGSGVWHSNNEYFFEWHRDYIQGLEQFILDKGFGDPYIPLPGWNPSGVIPDPFINLIEEGIFNLPTMDPNEDNIMDPWIGATDPGQEIMYQVDDMTCEQFIDINDFAGTIRAESTANFISHNAVHFHLSGPMAQVETASGAAIFWLFHAHVDELYHCYQTECEDCEPAYVRPVRYIKGCDYCFDFNSNITDLEYVLVDSEGTEVNINLESNGCIPRHELSSGEEYTLIITGSNDSSFESTYCNKDEVSFSFVAPIVPEPTKWYPDPCILIKTIPQTPVPGNFSDEMRFTISNEGSTRFIEVYNVHTSTGAIKTLNSGVLITENSSIEIVIPPETVPVGSNHFVIEVEGEIIQIQYSVL